MLPLDQTFTFRDQAVAWGTIGEGEPIILIHGFPWSAQAWRRIAPHLARERNIFHHCYLGFGSATVLTIK